MRAFATMLPRLDAEERLAGIEAGSVAFGTRDKHDARRTLRALQDAARGGRHGRERVKANPAQLAAMGIAVVEVPVPEPADG